MSGSKIVAAAGGFMALLASAGVSSAATQATQECTLGTDYPVTSVAAHRRPLETGGYGGTVNPVLRGADMRVAAQPGLTAEWLERKLESQVAAGVCQFGVANPSVEVISEGDSFVVRVTTTAETGAVARRTAADEQGARLILDRANQIPTR
jgi:hypothetical protein